MNLCHEASAQTTKASSSAWLASNDADVPAYMLECKPSRVARKKRAPVSNERRTLLPDDSPVSLQSLAPFGRHFPDDAGPSDHLKFLHGGAVTEARYVSIRRLGNKRNLTSHLDFEVRKDNIGTFAQWIDELKGESRVFMTQADFSLNAKDSRWVQCDATHLNSIRVIFVDLDFYNISKNSTDEPPESVSDRIVAACLACGVPAPVVIYSGNGMYAYWALESSYLAHDVESIQRWQSVQSKLRRVLSDFYPDPKVKDLTRVLRLVGTVNEKTGKKVRVLHDDGNCYSFDLLEQITLSVPDMHVVPTVVAKEPKSVGMESLASRNMRSSRRLKVSISPVSPKSTTDKMVKSSVDPHALSALSAQITAESRLLDVMNPTRARHYKIFRDIARVILARGGLFEGHRDEFIFWMIVERFHAGLCSPDEVPALAAQFAGLTSGRLDIWEEGYLKSLHNIMMRQVEKHGFMRPKRKMPTKFSAFQAVRKRSYGTHCDWHQSCAQEVAPKQYARSLVYIAKVSTLVERLGISADEQMLLDVLIGEDEKKRRRYATSATAWKLRRDDGIRQQSYKHTGGHKGKGSSKSLVELARKSMVSISTVYRAINLADGVKAARASRAAILDESKRTLHSIVAVMPRLSIRKLATMSGASPASVHRWLKSTASHISTMPSLEDVQLPTSFTGTCFSISLFQGAGRQIKTLFPVIAHPIETPLVLAFIAVSTHQNIADYMEVKEEGEGERCKHQIDVHACGAYLTEELECRGVRFRLAASLLARQNFVSDEDDVDPGAMWIEAVKTGVGLFGRLATKSQLIGDTASNEVEKYTAGISAVLALRDVMCGDRTDSG